MPCAQRVFITLHINNMASSDKLHELIHSLSSSEKRYFKLYANRFAQKDKFYSFQIYTIILKQKEYKEEELYEKLNGKISKKRLAVEKFNLFQLLLDSLGNYYSKSYINIELLKVIQNIHVLWIKGFFREARQQIRKHKKIAYKTKNHYCLLHLLDIEMQLINTTTTVAFDEINVDARRLLDEVSVSLSVLSENSKIDQLVLAYNEVIMNCHVKNREILRVSKALERDYPIINNQESLNSYEAIYKVCRICFGIAKNCKEYPKMKLIARRNIDFFKKKCPEFNEGFIDYFFYTKILVDYLVSFLYSDIEENNEDLILNVLDELKSTLNKFVSTTKIHINIHVQMCKGIGTLLMYYGAKNEKENLLPLIQEIENIRAHYMKTSELIDSDDALGVHFLSVGYFHLGNYNQAWTYNNRVVEYTREHYKISNLFITAFIFNLIIHYELGNYQLLTYQLETATNQVKKIVGSFEWELVLIKQLKKIIGYAPSDTRVQSYFEELSIVLDELFQDAFEAESNIYFNYRLWINQKKERFIPNV